MRPPAQGGPATPPPTNMEEPVKTVADVEMISIDEIAKDLGIDRQTAYTRMNETGIRYTVIKLDPKDRKGIRHYPKQLVRDHLLGN